MKKLFTIIALAVVTLSASAQKLGHITSQELMIEMTEYKAASTELERYRGELMKELEMLSGLIKEKEDEFTRDAPSLTPEIKESRYNELMASGQMFQQKQAEAEQKYQEKEAMLMQTVLKKIQEVVEKVAKDNGFAYIFDKSNLHYAGGEDITPLVKKELGIIAE